ncbi:MAG: hypothetical protein AAF436_21835, partial [Myxococcota bacterium]
MRGCCFLLTTWMTLVSLGCGSDGSLDSSTEPICETSYTLLTRSGGRVDWSKANGKIAFDSAKLPEAAARGGFQTYTMNADGSDVRCVSCEAFGEGASVGQPAWGPEGRWIVVQVAFASCSLPDVLKHPGAGFSAELWAFDTETGASRLLRETACDASAGTLHPHFSEDGTKLVWGEASKRIDFSDPALNFGAWTLMVADVEWTSEGPSIGDTQSYQPGIEGFYESHSFDQTNRYLLHTATNQTQPGFQQTTLSELDLETGEVVVLASGGFNEHGAYTADQRSAIYMGDPERTEELARDGFRNNDIWVVRRNGDNPQKVTTFNVPGEFPL